MQNSEKIRIGRILRVNCFLSNLKRRMFNQKFISKSVFLENGVKNGVSAYTCVNVFRRQYSSWKQVNYERHFGHKYPQASYIRCYKILFQKTPSRKTAGIGSNSQKLTKPKLWKLKYLFGKKQESFGLFQVCQIPQFIEPPTQDNQQEV